MNELKGLLTKSDHPCDGEFNDQLKKFIPCHIDIESNCNKCIWEKNGSANRKLMKIIPIISLGE